MRKFFQVVLGVAAVSTVALAQSVVAQSQGFHAPDDSYQVRYAANLAVGDSVVNITNAGSEGGFDTGRDNGNICANVYVFAEDQQLVSCCTCPLTPNHLKTLSVRNDLINNTLTPGVPIGVTVALLATNQPSAPATCNAATLPGGDNGPGWYHPPLAAGMRAWGTTIHATPASGYGVTETEFSDAYLSDSELYKLTSYCGFIQANGSGYGICNPCQQGAQGAKRAQ